MHSHSHWCILLPDTGCESWWSLWAVGIPPPPVCIHTCWRAGLNWWSSALIRHASCLLSPCLHSEHPFTENAVRICHSQHMWIRSDFWEQAKSYMSWVNKIPEMRNKLSYLWSFIYHAIPFLMQNYYKCYDLGTAWSTADFRQYDPHCWVADILKQ